MNTQNQTDTAELSVAVSAALAEMLHTDISAIRIVSWRAAGDAKAGSRQETIAAISAAIAETLDTEVSGIRIVSFRQV